MYSTGIVFPTLKNPEEYDKVEPKVCENCARSFMRLVGTESKICGQCQARIALNQKKSREIDALLRAKSQSPKVQ